MTPLQRRALIALRISLAFIWLHTAVISAVLSPELGLSLLAQIPITGALAKAIMYSTAGAEAVLAILLLQNRWRRPLALLQGSLILGFTLIISLVPGLRSLWLHPFGPISKNLPLLAAIFVLFSFDEQQ